MKCSLCGFEFNETNARSGCDSCAIVKGCDMIKCPNCSFEMAPEPKWFKTIKDKWTRRKKHGFN